MKVLAMIPDNLAAIHSRIDKAAHSADRMPADVKLVAVSKRISAEPILTAVDSGQLIFDYPGETVLHGCAFAVLPRRAPGREVCRNKGQ